jgi:flagellar motility protein MotE (MotC chaperone)
VRPRLRRPRQLARDLLAAARRDHEEVADYLETHGEEWEALAEAAPGDAADVLEQLNEEVAAGLLAELEPEEVADILEQISPELAAELVEDVPLEDLTAAVSEMTGEAAADLLYELDDDVTESVLALLDDESEKEIRRLLEYPSDTAGGLMTTEIASLPMGLTAGEAIERIRQLHDEYEDLSYVYVVDDASRLKGVIYFRDLVFARPGASLEEVMVPEPVSRRSPSWHSATTCSASRSLTSTVSSSVSSPPTRSSRPCRTRPPRTSPPRWAPASGRRSTPTSPSRSGPGRHGSCSISSLP